MRILLLVVVLAVVVVVAAAVVVVVVVVVLATQIILGPENRQIGGVVVYLWDPRSKKKTANKHRKCRCFLRLGSPKPRYSIGQYLAYAYVFSRLGLRR